MNKIEIDAKQRQLDNQKKILQADLVRATKSATRATLEALNARGQALIAEQAELDEQRATYEKAMKLSDMGGAKGFEVSSTETANKPASLHISEADYRGLYEAVQKRLPSYRIEAKSIDAITKDAFGTGDFTSGNLPPALLPQLTAELPYEDDDIFAHFLQEKAPEAHSVEYLRHSGNTNPAAPTAELAQKPDLGMTWTTVTTSFTKIAALQEFSDEALADFPYFMQIVPSEMFAALKDARSDQVINGDGTGANMLGLLNQSGTLTRAQGSDTPIDCLRKAVNDLRVGSAYSRANLILLNPTTWADLQLVKSSQGLYVLNPNDPNALGDLDNIFGTRVVANTKVPAGKAIVLDTTKAVLAWRRSGPVFDINQYGDTEWTHNSVSFRVEERVAIGVRYPAAINIVSGLAVS